MANSVDRGISLGMGIIDRIMAEEARDKRQRFSEKTSTLRYLTDRKRSSGDARGYAESQNLLNDHLGLGVTTTPYIKGKSTDFDFSPLTDKQNLMLDSSRRAEAEIKGGEKVRKIGDYKSAVGTIEDKNINASGQQSDLIAYQKALWEKSLSGKILSADEKFIADMSHEDILERASGTRGVVPKGALSPDQIYLNSLKKEVAGIDPETDKDIDFYNTSNLEKAKITREAGRQKIKNNALRVEGEEYNKDYEEYLANPTGHNRKKIVRKYGRKRISRIVGEKGKLAEFEKIREEINGINDHFGWQRENIRPRDFGIVVGVGGRKKGGKPQTFYATLFNPVTAKKVLNPVPFKVKWDEDPETVAMKRFGNKFVKDVSAITTDPEKALKQETRSLAVDTYKNKDYITLKTNVDKEAGGYWKDADDRKEYASQLDEARPWLSHTWNKKKKKFIAMPIKVEDDKGRRGVIVVVGDGFGFKRIGGGVTPISDSRAEDYFKIQMIDKGRPTYDAGNKGE